MSTQLRVLLVEDMPDDAFLLVRQLRCAGFEPLCQRVTSLEEFCTHLHSGFDLILVDPQVPAFSVTAALSLLQRRGLDVPLIVVSDAVGEEEEAVLLQQGVTDWLFKDRLGRLGHAVRQAMEQRRLRHQQRKVQEVLWENQTPLVALGDGAPLGVFLLDLKNTAAMPMAAA